MFVFDEVVPGANGDVPSFHEFSISGETFEPKGDITLVPAGGRGGGGAKSVNVDDYAALRELATICSMCNEASVDYNQVWIEIQLISFICVHCQIIR